MIAGLHGQIREMVLLRQGPAVLGQRPGDGFVEDEPELGGDHRPQETFSIRSPNHDCNDPGGSLDSARKRMKRACLYQTGEVSEDGRRY